MGILDLYSVNENRKAVIRIPETLLYLDKVYKIYPLVKEWSYKEILLHAFYLCCIFLAMNSIPYFSGVDVLLCLINDVGHHPFFFRKAIQDNREQNKDQ